jgi:hypothetical protein
MNDKFDELAKGLAQSVTRRAALKKFGLGFVGIALATLGLANNTEAGKRCTSHADCPRSKACVGGVCVPCKSAPCDCNVQYFGCCPNDIDCIRNCAHSCL